MLDSTLKVLFQTGVQTAVEAMKSMISTAECERLDRIPTKLNEFGYDPFGFSPEYVKLVLPIVQWFYKYYFRVEAHGIGNIPDGRVLLVANHSGQLPVDGMVIASSTLLEGDRPRFMRTMVERWVTTLPFVSIFLARCGQVIGIPENCEKLLNDGEAILVFPEGVNGISKTFDKRYQLQDFGRGFMRLALSTQSPIVPVAVIGAEEQMPSFYNAKSIGRLLGAPAFPITPTFPWLFPLGLLPYPVKYRIYFGEPMHFDGDPNDDDASINRKVDQVKAQIQRLLNTGLAQRKNIFW